MKEMTIDNLQNNSILVQEELETKKTMQEFEKSIKEDLEKINSFTVNNIDELLSMIFDNCQDITEIEYYINTLKNLIIKDQYDKEKYMYQKDLTRKNIIDNNIYNIYGVYSATAIASMLFTNNPISLLQNFILITAIQVFAFKVNLDYFTSNTYKNKLNKRIKQIDESKDIDNYHVKVLYRFRDMCIDVLKIQVAKLYELMQSSKNNIDINERLLQLLNGMDIKFILEDKKVLTKKKNK